MLTAEQVIQAMATRDTQHLREPPNAVSAIGQWMKNCKRAVYDGDDFGDPDPRAVIAAINEIGAARARRWSTRRHGER